ncbi:hypothetical protein [Mycobacterium sp.]|uniref:hypothetical protein n=1 Tax=Mycobacterium sp. TaxID=1785 RepID=UPI003F96E9AA
METSVGSATIVPPAPDDRCIINGEEVVPQPFGVHGGRTTGRVVGAFTGVPGSMACSGFVYQRRAGRNPDQVQRPAHGGMKDRLHPALRPTTSQRKAHLNGGDDLWGRLGCAVL